MAEIVNLRTVRKRKAQAEKRRTAEDNRIRHGRSKTERNATEAENHRASALHAAHRLEKIGRDGPGELDR